MTGEMRVNPPELRLGSRGLEEAADGIPEPPEQFTSPGEDHLSVTLTSRTQQIEAALIAGLPETKTQAKGTAKNIGTAADMYERTDQEISDQVRKRMSDFDSVYGPPKSSAGGGGAEQSLGQFGQLAQMPMQVAQQLGQVPAQGAQQAGQVPQAVLQGVQQVSQMAGGLGAGSTSGPGESRESKESGTAEKDSGSDDKDKAQQPETNEVGPGEKLSVPGRQVEPPTAQGASGGESAPRAPVVAPTPTQAPTVDPSILL